MADYNRVRILVVGDSGVGKTSLVQLICTGKAPAHPAWTVGCSVEIKLHEFKAGTPDEMPYFLELVDVGGSRSHQNARVVFYTPCHACILVHDLSNRKSLENLQNWLSEILLYASTECEKVLVSPQRVATKSPLDEELRTGEPEFPLLIVGTKQDLIGSAQNLTKFSSSIASKFFCDEIRLNCYDPKCLAAGSTNSLKLSRFFDQVIQKQYCSNIIGKNTRKML